MRNNNNIIFISPLVPEVPGNFNLQMIEDSSMTLSAIWMVPVPANGEISVYTINCAETESGTVVPAFSVNAPSTSTTLMGLTAYTEYSCVISATTGAGEGDPSGAQVARTDEDSKKLCT